MMTQNAPLSSLKTSTKEGELPNPSTASSEGVTVLNNISSTLPIENLDFNKRIRRTSRSFVPNNIPLNPGLYPTVSIKNIHDQQLYHYLTARRPQSKCIIPIENQSLIKVLQEYNNIPKKIAQRKKKRTKQTSKPKSSPT